MNPRTKPTVNAPLPSPAAAQDPTYSALTHEFQELCGFAMDQAIGLEKASFDAVLQMQSRVIDACDFSKYEVSKFDVSKFEVSKYQAASCVTPGFGNLFDLMAQAMASFMELQLACLKMLTPRASHQTESVLHLVEPARQAAVTSAPAPAHPPAHVLAHSMDIAIGARAA